jgi:hypothetical protein
MFRKITHKNYFHEYIMIILNSRMLPSIQCKYNNSLCQLFNYYYQIAVLPVFYFHISILYVPRIV